MPGTSVSSISSANAFVAAGAPLHVSGGWRLGPAQVYCVGMVALLAKASLVSVIDATAVAPAVEGRGADVAPALTPGVALPDVPAGVAVFELLEPPQAVRANSAARAARARMR